MTARLNSKVISFMSFSNGYLTLHFPKYTRIYECDKYTAYQLSYSPEPTKFFNQNIKGKLRIIN